MSRIWVTVFHLPFAPGFEGSQALAALALLVMVVMSTLCFCPLCSNGCAVDIPDRHHHWGSGTPWIFSLQKNRLPFTRSTQAAKVSFCVLTWLSISDPYFLFQCYIWDCAFVCSGGGGLATVFLTCALNATHCFGSFQLKQPCETL